MKTGTKFLCNSGVRVATSSDPITSEGIAAGQIGNQVSIVAFSSTPNSPPNNANALATFTFKTTADGLMHKDS